MATSEEVPDNLESIEKRLKLLKEMVGKYDKTMAKKVENQRRKTGFLPETRFRKAIIAGVSGGTLIVLLAISLPLRSEFKEMLILTVAPIFATLLILYWNPLSVRLYKY